MGNSARLAGREPAAGAVGNRHQRQHDGDFDQDPDFEERYFSGVNDVTCYECRGNKVVAVPVDRDNLNERDREAYDAWESAEQGDYDYAAECEAERRMGY